ncbi:tetratricopeptide repeat protein [Rheinheimera sp. YQF-2]|uniref:Tetratricopeptide repeat protein n=1 Tax=Rheinheimera lutimaris TaxID=2740584 RepID=A0A7Y5ARW9_9GAMM|nr:tetratricopeptide repeat protein [Rheinheimera lutimaris]
MLHNTRYTAVKTITAVTMLLRLALVLLLLPGSVAAEPLVQRLTHAASNAEQVSNHLLSQPTDSLSAEDWLVLTEAQLRLRNKDAAIDAVSRALTLTQDSYLRAHAYLLKAQVYGILYRDTVIAITQLEQAEQLIQHAEDAQGRDLYSDVLQNFAQAYNQLGNIPQAIPYAERSLQLAQQTQQPAAELKARITLGRLTLQNNAYGEAYQHLNQALALATELQDDEALASIHFRLGMAYRKIEDHKQALHHLQQARQRYHALQRHSSYTYTLIYIGETYLEDSSTAAQAADVLQEALTLARQQDDLLRVGIALQGLGRLAELQQQPEQAQQYFSDALQLFRQQNIQTYLQESSIALAGLLFKQQQFSRATALLQDIAPQIEQTPAYLKFRYNELAAQLAAQRGDWPLAYQHMQQAGSLRFEQFSEQNKLQLNMINNGLVQVATKVQHQAALQQLQQVVQQQRAAIVALQVTLALLLLSTAVLLLWYRRRVKQRAKVQPLLSPGWNSFCQRLQQHSNKTNLTLMAFAGNNSQQLKLQFGEQRLHLATHSFLQQLAPEQIVASCVQDDVIWLAVNAPQAEAAVLQQQLARQLQQLLLPHLAKGTIAGLISLRLTLAQVLEKPWQISELSALREALWLCWSLANTQDAVDNCRLLWLDSSQPGTCEWRSNMVRQDLINAIRLGSISLSCNSLVLPATIVDHLN